MTPARLEVWGDPIGHSRSPDLHAAAYRALGLDWQFARREVSADRFGGELAASRVRGLAVTYPLKALAFSVAAWRDKRAEVTGVANTLLFGERVRAYNTDVGGIARALDGIGAGDAQSVRIVGSGATSTSTLVALREMGVEWVEVAARRPERAAALVALGEQIGVVTRFAPLTEVDGTVDLTVSTLPGGAELGPNVAERLSRLGGTLFDVSYGDWPSSLARRWSGDAHHGLGMLLYQAVLQVRVFVSGTPDEPLPSEPAVVDAMRDALRALGRVD